MNNIKIIDIYDGMEWYIYAMRLEILSQKHGDYTLYELASEFRTSKFDPLFKLANDSSVSQFFQQILDSETDSDIQLLTYWELYQRKLTDLDECKNKIKELYKEISDDDFKSSLSWKISFV